VLSAQVLTAHVPEPWRGFGLLYPSFLEDEPRRTTFEAMAERMVDDIRKHQASGPYLLMGYSMGGFMCVELARRLKQLGHRAGIVLIDVKLFQHAPLLPFHKRLPKKAYWVLRQRIERWTKRSKDAQFLAAKRQISNLGDQTKAPHKSPAFQRAIEDGRAAMKAYSLTEVDVPLALIRCEEMAWWDALHQWPDDYGWGKYARVVGVFTSPGDHLGMVRGPQLVHVGRAMGKALAMVRDAADQLPPSVRTVAPVFPIGSSSS